MEALIVIDYTNDFIANDGALTCGKVGQDIEQNVVQLIKHFNANQDYIVFATDIHDENDSFHPETALFPSHNIVNTRGRLLYGSVDKIAHSLQSNRVYFMDKRRYSAFSGTNLDQKLRERDIHTIHLCGVCTDICVLHTAIDAYNFGYNIVIHQNAVASFNQKGHDYALTHLKNVLGATIIE